jgi:spore germination protein GerM
MKFGKIVRFIIAFALFYIVYAVLVAPNPLTFTVYYPNSDATGLVGFSKVENLPEEELYAHAISFLVRGTTEEGLVDPLPEGTHLLPFSDGGPIRVKGKTVEVNFSRALVDNHPGGSAGEIMTVGSIVNTLTSFNKVDYVQIYVGGEIVETLAGHLSIDQPLEKMPELIIGGE